MNKMELIQASSTSTSSKNRVREPPSVPFLWEIRPGIPKKDWKPEASSSVVSSVPTTVPPVKLIASVPFQWEEKPGVPLPSYSQPSQELVLYSYTPKDFDIDESMDWLWTDDEAYEEDDDERIMSIMGLETVGSETDGSYSSAVPSSLLANCLVSSLAISAAVPAQDNKGCAVESESPSSPALTGSPESTTSSYATGNSSLVGSSFLERMFPLFPPKSGFLGTVGTSSKARGPREFDSQKLDIESDWRTATARRPLLTLGELIMMSRRRSCRRKADQMRKYDISMEFARGRAFGCYGIGNGRKTVEALQSKWKQLPRLKLVW